METEIGQICLSCLASLCLAMPAAGETIYADLIITGGRVYTLNSSQRVAQAVAVKDRHIIYVGDAAGVAPYRGLNTTTLDLGSKVLLPGFIDAHGHLLSLGRSLAELNLAGTLSAEQIRQMVQERQKSVSAGTWICGRGWDQNDWEKKDFPTWQDLAGTEANPVYLRRVDGHAAWVNRAALDLAGINRDSADPPGGRILRDPQGHPTGVLVDNAIELVRPLIPQPTPAQRREWAKTALLECHCYGLTGVHDAGVDEQTLAIYQELQSAGELTLRIYALLDDADSTFLDAQLKKGPQVLEEHLVVRAVKLYADGALGSRGAALLEPYSDDPGNCGLLVNSPDYLYRRAKQALESGFQVCTHAIGDAGNRAALDAYERALRDKLLKDHRLRIEHGQVIAPEDFARFAGLGIIASMQPTHATSDIPWAEERLGAERIRGAYAWRNLLDQGCRLALGSDFPIESPNPLWGIYAAVTRQDQQGNPAGGWHPEERLTVEEAVKGFTIDAAYAEFAENTKGTIEVGKLADFAVLDRDIFDIPARGILQTKVAYTIVGGKIVYAGK